MREHQERQVVVPSSPNEPVPEVRVAAKVATYLVFDADIDRDSVEVEGRATRFRLVDPGERTLYLEPLEPPEEGERLSVRVRYKDGASPASASFALVSHPTVVDTRVEVVRRPSTPEVQVLEAALAQCEAEGPSNLVLSGRLDAAGVRAHSARLGERVQAGMKLLGGVGYRASTWALVAVRVHNLPGQQPWTSGKVSKDSIRTCLPPQFSRGNAGPNEGPLPG